MGSGSPSGSGPGLDRKRELERIRLRNGKRYQANLAPAQEWEVVAGSSSSGQGSGKTGPNRVASREWHNPLKKWCSGVAIHGIRANIEEKEHLLWSV